ncbi:MAG: T9SS type A sorting domain-containing protein [Ignavibacteriae bacterium]|nr:T9SS C-terminal target domain-containing protein [Ignavibacteriota bacterium]NOG97501.1 T9SS type A sorting domain-containing protein [Ignavibacteriota bacterium]
MKILAMLLIAASIIQAQSETAHKIPFASEGNSIELAVLNSSLIDIQGVHVEAIDLPAWVKFAEKKITLTELASAQEGIATFNFKVDKEAPVGEITNLKFQITSLNGEVWTKEISISVSPPEDFELYQNYPNPFNPSTTIEYLLPVESNVTLKIYDILGAEVDVLVKEKLSAGFHKTEWTANNYSSGMYIYQLQIEGENIETKFFRKKMLLVK